MIKNVELFADQLRALNPNHARKIRVLQLSKRIRLFNISPRSLKYPKGYYWDYDAYIITNKGNVPFWKTRKYNVILHKRM